MVGRVYMRPVDPVNGRISSYTAHTRRRPPSQEAGVDYYCPIGTPIRAAYSGRVAEIGGGIRPATGRFITVNLTTGHRTRDLHLLEWWKRPGDWVERGDILGLSGASGYGSEYFGASHVNDATMIRNTGGPHVHRTLWSSHSYSFGTAQRTLDFEQFVDLSIFAGGSASPFTPEEDELSKAEVDELKEFIRTQGFDQHEETRRYAAGVPGNGAFLEAYRQSDTPTDGVKRVYALYKNTRGDHFRVWVTNPTHVAALGDVKELPRAVLLNYKEWPSDGVNARPGVFEEYVQSADTGSVFELYHDNRGNRVRRLVTDVETVGRVGEVRVVPRAYIIQYAPINQDTP